MKLLDCYISYNGAVNFAFSQNYLAACSSNNNRPKCIIMLYTFTEIQLALSHDTVNFTEHTRGDTMIRESKGALTTIACSFLIPFPTAHNGQNCDERGRRCLPGRECDDHTRP